MKRIQTHVLESGEDLTVANLTGFLNPLPDDAVVKVTHSALSDRPDDSGRVSTVTIITVEIVEELKS